MLVRLFFVAGPDRGRAVSLGVFPIVIGRGRDTDTCLNDPYVSRAHCRIELRGTNLTLVDLQSASGTFVNDERINEKVLQVGDVIRVGDTQLRLEEDIADQATLVPTEPVVRRLDEPMPLDASPPVRKSAPPARKPLPPVPAPAAPAPPPSPPPPVPVPEKPAAPAKAEQPGALPPNVGDLSGHVLAHFRIGPILARGNSGIVFQATDLRANRQVALKVLRPEFSKDPTAVQRFIRSMKTVLSLRHPNLVTLYGAGKRGPYCWIAMEYIDGESLTSIIKRIGVAGMLDWKKAYWVAVHIGRALQFAHEHSIIHRNLTPQNVIVQHKGKVARLGDLMLAKAYEGSCMDELTRPGEILGDVRYVPPERTMGTADLDNRSDLYSLGALVYALLTGRPPFEGGSLVETLMLIREGKVAPPKQYQLAIPDAFQAVVMRLLAKRPEDRFQTAEKLLEELERVGMFQGLID